MNSTNNNMMPAIDLNSVINGTLRSMTIGQLLDLFMNLLISNDPRKDQFEEIKRTEIIPRFVKNEWYSQQLFRLVQTFPCNRLIITKDGEKVFESDNIDMWFIALTYYHAYFEDSTNSGFCWQNSDDGKFYNADFAR